MSSGASVKKSECESLFSPAKPSHVPATLSRHFPSTKTKKPSQTQPHQSPSSQVTKSSQKPTAMKVIVAASLLLSGTFAFTVPKPATNSRSSSWSPMQPTTTAPTTNRVAIHADADASSHPTRTPPPTHHRLISPLFMGRAAAVRAATKGKTDAKKAKVNGYYGKKIIMAVKQGGSSDPVANRQLGDLIKAAKNNSVPIDVREQLIYLFVC